MTRILYKNALQNTETLVKRFIKGDRKAQYSLYENYADTVYFSCFRLVQSNEEAEDIVQEVFIKAFADIKKLKNRASFGSWIKQMAIHKSLNSLRLKKLHFTQLNENIPEIHDEAIDYHIDSAAIKQAIAELPLGSRTVLNLYLLENYKHAEIAEMLDISVSTSKSQYARAKQLLKLKLKKDER
jgi:RNA polymerase sigma-70 factor (ECF subfamily)